MVNATTFWVLKDATWGYVSLPILTESMAANCDVLKAWNCSVLRVRI